MGSPSMNLVLADVRDGSVSFGGYTLPLSGEKRGVSGRVILGIRPSAFEDAALARSSDLPVIDVEVEVVEELGTETHLIFGVAAPPVLSDDVAAALDERDEDAQLLVHDDVDERSSFTASVDAGTTARPGTRLRLAVDNRAFHFFDPETGRALG